MTRTRWEIIVVLLLSYGMSALYGIVGIIDRMTRTTPLKDQTATINRSLATQELLDLVYQLLGIVAGLAPVALVFWLVWRSNAPHLGTIGLGWDSGRRRRLVTREVGRGVALAALIGVPGIAVYLAARELGVAVAVIPTALDAHWWTVPVLLLWACRAGIGEEVIVVGYLFDRLRAIGWTPWAIVVVAALLRGTYHLYQGWGGFAGNIAMGLIFGWFYLRKGRLLPLIVAHVLIDSVAFVGYPLATAMFPDLFGV